MLEVKGKRRDKHIINYRYIFTLLEIVKAHLEKDSKCLSSNGQIKSCFTSFCDIGLQVERRDSGKYHFQKVLFQYKS